MNEPTHGELLDEIRAMRAEFEWLIDMKEDITEGVEVVRAIRVGGKGVKWIASIATALLTLGGLMLAIRAMWQTFWSGS